MKKRITSVLLALVMLLSLVPTMGTTAFAAETESHPTAVGALTKGTEACYYRIYPDGTGKTVTMLGSAQADSNKSVTENWNTFKSKIGTKYDNDRTINGVAYYDPDSGVLYVSGCITDNCTAVIPSTEYSDVLTVIVDGDTIGGGGWHVEVEKDCLKKLNVEFRNNSTLTLQKCGNYTGSVLGVTGHNITGDVREQNRPVANAGDLTLSGSGTLKIDIPHYANVMYCLRAKNISVKDNVSLDIKTVGNTFYGKYGSEIVVRSAAIYCYEKLNIDTTGTVNIVAEKTPTSSTVSDRGSFNAFSNIDAGRFNLVNAQSVTLNVVEQGDTFVNLYGDYQQDWYNAVKRTAEGNGWTVTETEDTASPYTLTLTRTANLSNLKLNVGGTSYAKDAVIPDHVVSDNASKKLSVSFDAGPQWFTTYYLKNKVNLNARVYIWKDDVFQSNFSIAQMSFGWTDGKLGFTLDVRNLDLEANKTYRVYVSVSPTMNGEYLAEPLTAQWTFKTTAKPVLKEITAVGLMQNFYLYPTGESSVSSPDIKISGTNQPYEITNASEWTADSSNPETYTRTVTLKANEGYKFTDSTKVTAVNADGAKPVDGVSTPTLNEDGTLSVTITTYKRYEVRFLDNDGHSTGNAAQYIRKDYKATAPDWEAAPSGKVFVGWKKTLSDSTEEALLPGEETEAITANTKYYAYTETVAKPEYSIEVEKTHVPAQTSFDSLTFELTIRNTGTVATGDLSVKFRSNSGNYSMYYNTYDEEETATKHEPDATTGVLTISSIPVGGSAVVCLELPEVTEACVSSCAVQVQNTENGIDRSVIVKTTRAAFNTVEVENGTADSTSEGEGAYYEGYVVTIRAREAQEHETFIGWTVKDTSPVQVVFSDPTAPVTQFVMPDKAPQITANFVTATVNGIAITKMPTKTEYTAGENFDPTGIEVKLTYTDGTMEDLPNNATLTYDPSTSLAAGTTSVKVSYTPEGGSELVTYLPITVKAQDAATYTVSYDANGGTGTMTSDTATQGVSFILPLCTFTPPAGKVFDKWDINGTQHAAGVSVDIPGNTTVKAIWKDIPTGMTITPPTANVPFTYDGSKQTGVTGGSGYTLTGTTEATNAGTYTAIASLSDPGYYWTDGTQLPKLIEWTINPADRSDKPNAPEMESRTTDSITLKAITAAGETVEYSMDGSYWQSSPVFTGLSSGTSYTFYARYAAKTNYNPSAASDGATFSTLSGGSSGGGGGSSTSSYAITVQGSKNGSVTADRKTASAGTTVTLTVSPDKGYTLEDLTVLDKNDKEIKLTAKNGKYTFTMPASNVEVEATFKAAKSGNPFVDVPSGAYYEDAVIWAVDKGVTSGTDATHFAPNGICTRAQAVTFLWRAAGSPAPKSTTMPFTDVAAGSYYEQAVLWAVENGITKGTGDTTFSPNLTCSRAQIVTFLWRSQKSPAAGSVNPFTDVSADAYYADAVLWAVKENVTSGTTATTFSPNADCTRAQIVTFIYRALAE